MKKIFLIFCTAWLIVLSTYKSHLKCSQNHDRGTSLCSNSRQNGVDNDPMLAKALMPKADTTDWIEILAADVYNLVIDGYSNDEIIEMINDSRDLPYNIRELILKIDELLNKQQSKEEIIKIIINDKEKEDEGFLEKAKNLHLILKIILTTGAIIGLGYLSYEVYQWWHKTWEFPWPGLRKKPNENTLPKNKDPEPSKNQDPVTHGDLTDKQQLDKERQAASGFMDELAREVQKQDQPIVGSVEGLNPNHGQSLPAAEIARQHNGNGLGIFPDQEWAAIGVTARFDDRLDEALTMQIENARNIGLEPVEMPLNDVRNYENRAPRPNLRFNDLIAQQIEYARGIGLVPAQLDNPL